MTIPLPDPHAAASTVPEDFIALVRDALVHLYDYTHLACHPLNRCLETTQYVEIARQLGTARALRNLLLDAIEAIQPGRQVARTDRACRPYIILVRRYVDGFAIEDILADLHISLRQFQREHRKGLVAVSSILWQSWPDAGREAVAIPADDASEASCGELRSEVARLGLEIQRVDLSGMIYHSLELARVLARECRVQLHISPPEGMVIMWADAALARQAILGSLSALISARPQRLTLRWHSIGDYAACVVHAEPPLAGHKTQTAIDLSHKLAVTLELLQAQGGKLQIAHEGDGISDVQLLFRRAEGASILMVDDNERLLQLFERYLASEGYRFRGCTYAEEALGAIENEMPEVIILDVMMRDTDGWQFLQMLRGNPTLSRVPVIVCSVLDDADLALALGAQCYLKKPVSQQQILETVRAVLGEHSSEGLHPAGH